MGADEMAQWLRAVGILTAEVAVGEERDRAWCVRPVPPEPDEEPGEVWEVFWSEDGGRFEWTRFDDEETACLCLFGRLTWVEVLRGRRFG